MKFYKRLLLVFGIFLFAACDTSETQGPDLVGGVIPPLPADTPRVADPQLKGHLPRIIAHSDGTDLSKMTLWAMGLDGLRQRVFDVGANAWGDWVIRGIPADALYPPPDWDDLGEVLNVDAAYDKTRPHVAVSYSYTARRGRDSAKLALASDEAPFGTTAGFTESSFGTSNWFDPVTSVSDEARQKFHLFGNWHRGGPNRPDERLVSVSFEVEADGEIKALQAEPREMPPLIIDGSEVEVKPGPNSAVHVPVPTDGGSRPSQTFVFVKWKRSNEDGVALWHDDHQGNSGWLDLGVPLSNAADIIGNPVAFTWYNGDLNRTSVNLFVVVRSGEGGGRAELYERYWSVDGNTPVANIEHWAPWKSHGSPLWDPADSSKGHFLEADTDWRLTKALTWSYQGVDRVNVFGIASPELDRDGNQQPHRLVEYVWNGSVWSWGNPHPPPPSGLGVRTLSAAATQQNGDYRISVATRADDGSILERYYLIDNSGWHGWYWNDLTD